MIGKTLKTEFTPAWGYVDQDRVVHFPFMWCHFKEEAALLWCPLPPPVDVSQ